MVLFSFRGIVLNISEVIDVQFNWFRPELKKKKNTN